MSIHVALTPKYFQKNAKCYKMTNVFALKEKMKGRSFKKSEFYKRDKKVLKTKTF